MRIFVGTLYSGENEFEECVASINRQKEVDYQHFVFKNLGAKEGANTLYQTFMDHSNEFDLFVKIDADMVLLDDFLFAKISQTFLKHDWLELFEIQIHDFFTNQPIWGLNTFRSTVKWDSFNDELFVDDFHPIKHTHRLRDKKTLAPAAIHCKNPSPFQSFHYGVHKALKMVQAGVRRKVASKTHSNWLKIQRTYEHFLAKQDIRLGFAVLGAELALKGIFATEHLNYTHPYMKDVFNRYRKYSLAQIKSEIFRLRCFNWGFLPNRMRRLVLCLTK